MGRDLGQLMAIRLAEIVTELLQSVSQHSKGSSHESNVLLVTQRFWVNNHSILCVSWKDKGCRNACKVLELIKVLLHCYQYRTTRQNSSTAPYCGAPLQCYSALQPASPYWSVFSAQTMRHSTKWTSSSTAPATKVTLAFQEMLRLPRKWHLHFTNYWTCDEKLLLHFFFCSMLLRCHSSCKEGPGRAPYSQHIMIRNWTNWIETNKMFSTFRPKIAIKQINKLDRRGSKLVPGEDRKNG